MAYSSIASYLDCLLEYASPLSPLNREYKTDNMSTSPSHFEEEQKREDIRRRERAYRLLEVYVWLISAAAFASFPIIADLWSGRDLSHALIGNQTLLFFSFLILMFPILYGLIFSELPLESLRLTNRQGSQSSMASREEKVSAAGAAAMRAFSTDLGLEDLSLSPAIKLFSYFALSSRLLAQSIFRRAGVYLLVGGFVAFSGLVFFYIQTTPVLGSPLGSQEASIPWNVFLVLLPKFGILFFIEVVAFFFLRQYRSAMDEFRYYEAIKRNREETLALIRIATDSGKALDPFELVKCGSFYSKAGILSKNETTEIVESRKLEKDELDLLEKVVNLVSRVKR
jgi:hypothetical protein